MVREEDPGRGIRTWMGIWPWGRRGTIPRGQTDTCENIAFLQFCLRAVKIVLTEKSNFLSHSDLFQTKINADGDMEEEDSHKTKKDRHGGHNPHIPHGSHGGESSPGNFHHKRAPSACWATALSVSFLVSGA